MRYIRHINSLRLAEKGRPGLVVLLELDVPVDDRGPPAERQVGVGLGGRDVEPLVRRPERAVGLLVRRCGSVGLLVRWRGAACTSVSSMARMPGMAPMRSAGEPGSAPSQGTGAGVGLGEKRRPRDVERGRRLGLDGRDDTARGVEDAVDMGNRGTDCRVCRGTDCRAWCAGLRMPLAGGVLSKWHDSRERPGSLSNWQPCARR